MFLRGFSLIFSLLKSFVCLPYRASNSLEIEACLTSPSSAGLFGRSASLHLFNYLEGICFTTYSISSVMLVKEDAK